MKTPREKYLNDPHYKALVDVMVMHIHKCDYTPSEMREAAMLASILYAESVVSPLYIKLPKNIEDSIEEIYKFQKEVLDK